MDCPRCSEPMTWHASLCTWLCLHLCGVTLVLATDNRT